MSNVAQSQKSTCQILVDLNATRYDVIEMQTIRYMWPGFIAEFNTKTQLFSVWELRGFSEREWILRPDIVAPPRECLGIENAL